LQISSNTVTFSYDAAADLSLLVASEERTLTVRMDANPAVTATFKFAVKISIC